MKPQTVLIVSGNGPPVFDGVGHYTARLLDNLSAARPEWQWVWLRRKRRWFTAPVGGRGRVRIIQPWHRWDRVGVAAARAVVTAIRPAIVHVQEQTHSFHETASAAAILDAAPRSTVVTAHEVHPESVGFRWTAAVIGRADVLLTNDAVTARKSELHVGRTPDGVLWSPANVLPPPDEWSVRRRAGLVVTFGFISEIKGLEPLHAALAVLRERVPELRWRIVGPFNPATNPHHAALANRFRADWIEFTGGRENLDDRQLRTWIAEAAVMALPFVDGASPRRGTLQTAWAFGLPVVTTPPPPGETGLHPGENCLTAPLDRPEEWTTALAQALADRGGRLACGSRVAGVAHGWERLCTEQLRVYDTILASCRGRTK